MANLVEQLREGIEPHEGITAAETLMEEAADEIERLQAIAYNVGLAIGCPTDHLDSWIMRK